MRVLGRKILIEELETEQHQDTILVMAKKKPKDSLGKVIAVGDDIKETEVKTGDVVKYISGHAVPATFEDKNILRIDISDIIYIQ